MRRGSLSCVLLHPTGYYSVEEPCSIFPDAFVESVGVAGRWVDRDSRLGRTGRAYSSGQPGRGWMVLGLEIAPELKYR